jgi:hypothetical protein
MFYYKKLVDAKKKENEQIEQSKKKSNSKVRVRK